MSFAEYGLTTGSFSVSSSGSANYSIPIWTPPGPNGVTPSISLSYNSASGNGVGGVGWHIGAVSSIERCPRTKHQDGAGANIQLFISDGYCLSGNRLRLVSGTYGVTGSVYYTELADYSRIKAFGSEGNGPQYFTVEGKNGLKYEYGYTANSRVLVGATAFRWMLNKVYDRNGNNYIVTYNNVSGFAVPDVISWTPVSHNSSSDRYEAKFNYLPTWRTNEDSIFQYGAGYSMANRYRLENIQIKSAGVVKRKYRLTYTISGVTSRSLLTSFKECADDAESNCLLPISFTYQGGQAGVTAGSVSAPAGSSNTIIKGRYDFNGDGKNDIVYWAGSWYVALGANTGFTGPYNTGATAANVLVDDFLPNGRAALVAAVGGTLWTYRWDDASSAFVANNSGVASAAPSNSADYNGDGLADLVYFTMGATSLSVRANVSTGSGNPTFWNLASTTASLPANRVYGGAWNYTGSGLQRADVNGDGRQDIMVRIVTTGMGGGATYSALMLGNGSGFDLPQQSDGILSGGINWPAIDFNGDRCTDRLEATTVKISTCNGVASASIAAPGMPIVLMDWDSDGRTDVLIDNGGTLGVYKSTGIGFSSVIATSLSSTGPYFDVDLDGDGQDDLVKANGASSISYWTHTATGQVPPTYATNVPDLLASATDGFGITDSPNYVSTAWSNYDKGAATSFPLQESEPSIVVGLVASSNGVGGTYNRTYYYVGARTHAERGTSVGFQRVDMTDKRNDIITRTYFEQSFPLSGMVSQLEVLQPNGVTPISRVQTTNSWSVLDSAANNQRYFVYPQSSSTTQFEVGSAWNGNALRTVTTNWVYDNDSGFAYDVLRSTVEPSSGSNGITGGGSWSERTYSPPANHVNDPVNWCIGRPGRTQQTNSHSLAYGSSITRTTDVIWNTVYCRPTHHYIELGTNQQVTTELGYDSFGNVGGQHVTGYGMPTRSTTALYSDGTHQTGQFPLSQTNALNQTSILAWNYDLGVPSSATDANGLTTSWQYDAFGRRTRENHPDTTYTTWVYRDCGPGSCGAYGKMFTFQTTRDASNARVTGDLVHLLDAFDRPLVRYVPTLGNPDNLSYAVESQYDSLGRLSQQSVPRMSKSTTVYWSTFSYDLVGRMTSASRPVSESPTTPQITNFFNEGLTTRIVDPQGKQTTKVISASGQLVRSSDHDGHYQDFEYDAFGNMKRVQDSADNILQTSIYNTRGMLTGRTDMDMGSWSFTPNALGETILQLDAKGQSTEFAFDLLGRLTSRVESEGTSVWTWGTSSAAKNIGKLQSVSGPGYSESYAYDSLARPSSTSISADTPYQIDYTYNPKGFLETIAYPISTNGCRFTIQLGYSFEFLKTISNVSNASQCGSTGEVYWTANEGNGFGQVIRETLGNGLVVNRAYDGVTSWLKSIQAGVGGGASVQNLAYEWDLVGNLKKRKDGNQSWLTEEFFYDNLYRLDSAELNGVENLDMAYDSLGNIMSKSDVGSFSYHATKRHQLTSTSNGWSFGYDNNGNMTTGRGNSITWTSYNYPQVISNSGSGQSSTFSYAPDRHCWKQVATFPAGPATTIYIGGLLEKVTTTAGVDFRHIIRGGSTTVMVSRQDNNVNSTFYVTSDHLGSSSAMTNSSGASLVQTSFDAIGRRRGSNWSGGVSGPDMEKIVGITRHGYTDHTMIDNLELIHMNGRAQDPQLGRFVSPDPFVSNPLNSQNFNRYSYVYNNPLSFTDPSGFDALCGAGKWAYYPGTDDRIPEEEQKKLKDGLQNGDISAATAAYRCGPEMRYGADGMLEITGTASVSRLSTSGGFYLPGVMVPANWAIPFRDFQSGGANGCVNWMIEWGNAMQDIADKGGKASLGLWATGAAITLHSAARFNTTGMEVGVATAAVGGVLGEGSALVQTLGGVLHGLGGAGWDNATHGAILFFGGQIIKNTFSAARMPTQSVSQRKARNIMVLSQNAGGLLYDVSSALTNLGPQQSGCKIPPLN